jgi:hypothetical protein
MNQNRRLLEETTRMKKLMSIKGGDVILESSFKNVDASVAAFGRASYGMLGTNIDGIMAVLNNLPNKETFISFNIAIKKNSGKTFEQHINDEFEDDNGPEALKIQQILKSKFNIDTDAGVTGTQYMNPRQRMFKKAFKITSLNTTDPNKKDGLSAYMDTTKEPIKDLTQKQPEQAKKETTTTSPQTYNDVLSGKGVLKTGVTSPAVGELQQKLLDLGYSAIAKPTNYFGTQTFNAVKDFQEKNSLTPDGKVGGNTSKKIDQILANKTTDNTSKSEEPTTTPNDRVLRSAVQSYVPKGVSRTADFS